ncbi:MAG: sulfide-dependent adenosine diphosphate thiazole synthase [Candidatus Cloacimonetes bacterium]|nr:sulfide-dependent adenosine diphosphate thiazole synthase [Candidatus Cloacimonadota bacterium]
MERTISTAICQEWFHKLSLHLENDVIIVGAGPSGLVCAAELSSKNIKTCIIESNLAPGGGMWGGAMLFNSIVVQEEARYILQKYGINHREHTPGFFVADAAEASSALIYQASHNGCAIFSGMRMEDVLVKDDRVRGVVVNWTPVLRLDMHVDPLSLLSGCVVDATGHPSEVVKVLVNKNQIALELPEKGIQGERSMNAEAGEKACIRYTSEVYPGLYVSGMAACGVSGSNRMGPIFGGMLLSGMKAAGLICSALGKA